MTKDTLNKATDALRDASRRNALLYASEDYSNAESLLHAAEDNRKLGRTDEAQLLASVALQRAEHAACLADAGKKGFTSHIVGFERVLQKQIAMLTCEIDAHRITLPVELEKTCRKDLLSARAALTRCAEARKRNQWLRAKGETVLAELSTQHVRITLDLARQPAPSFVSLKTKSEQHDPAGTAAHVKEKMKDPSVMAV